MIYYQQNTVCKTFLFVKHSKKCLEDANRMNIGLHMDLLVGLYRICFVCFPPLREGFRGLNLSKGFILLALRF